MPKTAQAPQLRGQKRSYDTQSKMAVGPCAETLCPPSTVIWSLSAQLPPAPQEPHPLPEIPVKQPCPRIVGTPCPLEPELTPLHSFQRLKSSFASEPQSVSFYCLQQHWAEGPLLGADLGGLVTLGAHIWLIWGILSSELRVCISIEGLYLLLPGAPRHCQPLNVWCFLGAVGSMI